VYGIEQTGAINLLAEISAVVPEPRIWNATDTPSIFNLGFDVTGFLLAAVPDLGKVHRIGAKQSGGNLAQRRRLAHHWSCHVRRFGLPWNADTHLSTSPCVRILRPNGTIEVTLAAFYQYGAEVRQITPVPSIRGGRGRKRHRSVPITGKRIPTTGPDRSDRLQANESLVFGVVGVRETSDRGTPFASHPPNAAGDFRFSIWDLGAGGRGARNREARI
jgi:hypothetical protein